jgi:colanic acid/amylovoran biosynthesis glycosyltransferase
MTENWIYPQITAVPDVDSAVLCHNTANLSLFRLNGRPLFARNSRLWRSMPAANIAKRAMRRFANQLCFHAALHRARHWRPSILHAHFGMQGWESLPFAKSVGAVLITSFYGYDAWLVPVACPEWCKRFKQLFAQGDLFLVEGRALRQRLIDLGCSTEKIRIQRLGVDTGALVYRKRNFAGPLKIAMVGRFVQKKGLVDGLKACAYAATSRVNLTVTIVGDASDIDAEGLAVKRELLSLAAVPELNGRVALAGSLSPDKLKESLAHHDVFLCPSKHDQNGDAEGGLPVVLLEAMALGLLCIGSRHCDIPEAIDHGKTGYLFDEGNILELSRIVCGLTANSEYCSELTKRARRHVEEQFDLAKQLTSLSYFYHYNRKKPEAELWNDDHAEAVGSNVGKRREETGAAYDNG